jgi:hypothetical protein
LLFINIKAFSFGIFLCNQKLYWLGFCQAACPAEECEMTVVDYLGSSWKCLDLCLCRSNFLFCIVELIFDLLQVLFCCWNFVSLLKWTSSTFNQWFLFAMGVMSFQYDIESCYMIKNMLHMVFYKLSIDCLMSF